MMDLSATAMLEILVCLPWLKADVYRAADPLRAMEELRLRNSVPRTFAVRVGTFRLGTFPVIYGVTQGMCHREYRNTAPKGANATLRNVSMSMLEVMALC